jgi:hypothetical protein
LAGRHDANFKGVRAEDDAVVRQARSAHLPVPTSHKKTAALTKEGAAVFFGWAV